MSLLYDFFRIDYGQREYHSKGHLIYKKDGIPLISSKGNNRGIYGYFDIIPKYKHVISVPSTGTICFAFYQGVECCIDDNCLVLTPKKEMTKEELIYFSLLIRKEKYKYAYGRQVTPSRLGNTVVPDEFLSWLDKKRNISYGNISYPASNKKIKLNMDNWKSFEYRNIFEVKKGKRKIMSKLKYGDCPFISSIDGNNGVKEYCNLIPNHKRNTITINYNGSVGEAFYQEQDFWASDDVNILYPKFELNSYIAMFLITIIKVERFRFNYGRKWHSERMRKSKIKLPVDSNGNPDWQFMENYIKSLPYSKALEN